MVGSIIGLFLVTSFFVTSSDSGSLVIDNITSGGKPDSPIPQRVFWATAEGAVAAVLLIGGGLGALQTASITTGLPFLFILVLMMYSLNKGLKSEYLKMTQLEKEPDTKRYEKKLEQTLSKKKAPQKD